MTFARLKFVRVELFFSVQGTAEFYFSLNDNLLIFFLNSQTLLFVFTVFFSPPAGIFLLPTKEIHSFSAFSNVRMVVFHV